MAGEKKLQRKSIVCNTKTTKKEHYKEYSKVKGKAIYANFSQQNKECCKGNFNCK